MTVDYRLKGSHETRGVEQGHQFVRALGGDDLRLDPKVSAFGHHALQPVEAGLGGS